MNAVIEWAGTHRRALQAAALALAVAGCTNTSVSEDLPRGAAAYAAIQPPGAEAVTEYRIKPFDILTISTFNEPGLTFAKIPIDAVGQFSFPFIGRVDAAGLSPHQIEMEIKQRLDARYTQNAQVTVFVASASGLLFTVEGDVKKPGAFEYTGETTLLQTLARAGSPTETAKLSEVVVFRVIDGQRYGGVFNAQDIREGRVDDPIIFPGDTVVVGYSAIKSGWREFLSIGPIVNAFTRF
ncbi:polysaccharide biosynthesis/export family protein [Qipengyuania marisflavi]|nr:polysaccharide biosynthesis/export family protein [Qipengyuania marisflavi]